MDLNNVSEYVLNQLQHKIPKRIDLKSPVLTLGNQDWTSLVYSGNSGVAYDSAEKGVVVTGISAVIKIRLRMPVDPDSTYHLVAKVRKKSGNGAFYLGAVSLTNAYAELSTDTQGSWNYFAASNQSLTIGVSTAIEGAISGYNPASPTAGVTTKFDPEANFFDLVLIANYNGNSGAPYETVIERLEIWRLPSKLKTPGDADIEGIIYAGSSNIALTNATGNILDAALSSNIPKLNVANTFTGGITVNANGTTTSAANTLTSGLGFISLNLGGNANTAGLTADQYSSALRFNGAGVAWGDVAYFPNGGDSGELGHFRFVLSSSAVDTSPDAKVGVGRLYAATAVLIGSTTDNGTDELQVTGSALITAGLTVSGGSVSLPAASIADAALSANVPLKNAANTFTADQIVSGAAADNRLIARGSGGVAGQGGLQIDQGSTYGFHLHASGTGGTGGVLNISYKNVGTDAVQNDTAKVTFNGTIESTGTNGFSGVGSNLTALTATNITLGTLADGRLSSNVPLKNAANTFTADQTLSATHALRLEGSATSTSKLRAFVTGDSNPRLDIAAGGTLSWGPGNAAVDTTLQRTGVGALSLSGSLTISTDLTVTGNLVVNGTTFTVNATDFNVEDKLIHLNQPETPGANDPVPTNYSGFAIHRGTVASVEREHAGFVWDETNSVWTASFMSNDTTLTTRVGIRVGTINANALITGSAGLTISAGAISLPAASIADAALSANIPLKNANNVFSGTTNQFAGVKLREPSSATYGAQISMGTASSWARGFRFSHDSNPNGADVSLAEFGVLGTGSAGTINYAVLGFGLSAANPLAYNGTHWLTMFPSGNVHIGGNTTDQGYKLFVNGQSWLNGNLTVNNRLHLQNNHAVYSNVTNPSVYGTGTGGSGFFNEAGHLILEPRLSGATRDVIFLGTGGAAVARMKGVGRFLIGEPTDDGASLLQVNGASKFLGATTTTGTAEFQGLVKIGDGNQDVVEHKSVEVETHNRTTETTYSSGLVDQVIEKDGVTVVKTTTFSYLANGNINTITIVGGGKTVTITYSYDGNANFTGTTRTVV